MKQGDSGALKVFCQVDVLQIDPLKTGEHD